MLENNFDCKKCGQNLNLKTYDLDIIQKTSYENVEVFEHLIDMAKGYIELEHPLCDKCLNIIENYQIENLELIDKEINYYKNLENILNGNGGSFKKHIFATAINFKKDKTKLDLKNNDMELNKRLNQLKVLYTRADQEHKFAVEENNRIHELESAAIELHNRSTLDNLVESDKDFTNNNHLKYMKSKSAKWDNIDPISFVFKISFNPQFGCINSYRMGRLSKSHSTQNNENCLQDGNVPWSEINLAWGQTALLLHVLARKCQYEFKRWKLILLGQNSEIQQQLLHNPIKPCEATKTKSSNEGEKQNENQECGQTYPLYYSGRGFKLFGDTRFDLGMTAFTDCMVELSEELQKRDPTFNLPYRIENGRFLEPVNTGTSQTTVLVYSIKAQFNSEENWTKALRYMLKNMQCLQNYVINM